LQACTVVETLTPYWLGVQGMVDKRAGRATKLSPRQGLVQMLGSKPGYVCVLWALAGGGSDGK